MSKYFEEVHFLRKEAILLNNSDKAVIVNFLRWSIRFKKEHYDKDGANRERYFHLNKWWVQDSYSAWEQRLPWLNIRTIRRYLEALCESQHVLRMRKSNPTKSGSEPYLYSLCDDLYPYTAEEIEQQKAEKQEAIEDSAEASGQDASPSGQSARPPQVDKVPDPSGQDARPQVDKQSTSSISNSPTQDSSNIHSPSSMEFVDSSFDVEKENTKGEQGNGDRESSQVGGKSPSFDVALKIAGSAMTSGQDAAMKLRKEAAEKKKVQDIEAASNRHLKRVETAKAKAKIPDGVTDEEWQNKVCSQILHDCFKDAMEECGYHAPNFSKTYIGVWKHKFLPKVGTIENGIRVIDWLVKNWSTVRLRTNLKEEQPTVNILGTGYMDSFIGSLLSRGGALSEPVVAQPKEESQGHGWAALYNEMRK